MVDDNTNDKQEKRFIDPETGATTASGSASGITGTGSEPDKGQTTNTNTSSEKPTTQNVRTSQGEPGTGLGGRGPGEPGNTIGDQDSTQARNDMGMVDPMTSRAPSDLDKITTHEKPDSKAQRDP